MNPIGLLERSLEHLGQAVRLGPGNPRYAAALGEALLLQGDPDAALGPLQASYQGDALPRTAYLLGLCLHAAGRDQEAAGCASAALEESSAFDRALRLRAACRQRVEDLSGALEDLRELVRGSPEEPRYGRALTRGLLRVAFLEQGQIRRTLLREARELLENQALWQEREGPRGYLLGVVCMGLGDPAAAEQALILATHEEPGEIPRRQEAARQACRGKGAIDVVPPLIAPDSLEPVDELRTVGVSEEPS